MATLATLILLSYTKLLQTIITALSSASLTYPDGSNNIVWLPDATIRYITGKHVILFITAIVILLIILVYTLILFSWQWFFHCPIRQFKWINKQKVTSFLETYHAPYTPKHRYWTGLVLLVRVCACLLSAFNPSGSDIKISRLVTTFTLSCLFLYMVVFQIRPYKNWFINAIETFTYFNIIALSTFVWYAFDTNRSQAVVTNISVGTTFVQLSTVLSYHLYKYRVFSRVQETAVCMRLNDKLKPIKRMRCNQQLPPDNDIHQFHDLFDMMDSPMNINVPPKHIEPTCSIVEVPKPRLAPPLPLDETQETTAEPEPQQQLSEQDDITVAVENQLVFIDKNEQSLNISSGIKVIDCEDTNL